MAVSEKIAVFRCKKCNNISNIDLKGTNEFCTWSCNPPHHEEYLDGYYVEEKEIAQAKLEVFDDFDDLIMQKGSKFYERYEKIYGDLKIKHQCLKKVERVW